MKPEKEPIDNVRCPKCLKTYAFVNCRWSQWDENGKRYELCTGCAIEKDKRDASINT